MAISAVYNKALKVFSKNVVWTVYVAVIHSVNITTQMDLKLSKCCAFAQLI